MLLMPQTRALLPMGVTRSRHCQLPIAKCQLLLGGKKAARNWQPAIGNDFTFAKPDVETLFCGMQRFEQ